LTDPAELFTKIEVVDVAGVDEEMRAQDVAQATTARPERQRCEEVQRSGPVAGGAQRLAVLLWSQPAQLEAAHRVRPAQEEPVANVEHLLPSGETCPPPINSKYDRQKK